MAFNSFQFAGFFFLVWVLVVVVFRHRTFRTLFGRQWRRASSLQVRNALLLVASYVFYGAWDPRFLLLIAASTGVDYICGLGIQRSTDPAVKKRLLGVSLGVNLGALGVFKYLDFFSTSLAELLSKLSIEADPLLLDVVLPVGISFYTFQTLSYTIDVYRGLMPAEKSLLNFATFVAFFPQLVAGPIERARDLLPQFRHYRPVTWSKMDSGFHLIGTGLFKKVVVGDTAAIVANAAFSLEDPTGVQSLVGVYAFAFQIYGDFSGYTDIARGVALCLGFELSKNFNLPYFAASPSEFWQRWHITLSSWLRDYLYIPLGGNRGNTLKTYRNLLLTMLLGGLWHGAAWTFVAWGAFHGLLLCLYRAFGERVKQLLPGPKVAWRYVGVFSFFQLTAISWLLFRAQSIEQAWQMFSSLWLSDWSEPMKQLVALGPVALAATWIGLLVATQMVSALLKDSAWPLRLPSPIRGVVYGSATALLVLFGQDAAEAFIYFQF